MGDRKEDDEERARLQARVNDLESALGQHNNGGLAARFGLTAKQSNLLGLLLAVECVTPDMIHQRLELATEAKVLVHRLRKHMRPFDVTIKGRRAVGYWLTRPDKDRIKATLAA
jgi:hypothetical protein